MLLEATAPPVAKRRARDPISFVAGAVGLAAIVFVAAIDLWWGLTVEGYSIVANTISNLAAGDESGTVDFAMKCFAISIAVIGAGLWRWDLGDRTSSPKRWVAGSVILLLLSPIVYWIARYDGYSGLPTSQMTIHLSLVGVLAVGFPLAAWLMGPGFAAVSLRWKVTSQLLALVWVPLAAYFMFMSTSWDGLYERGLAAILLGWLGIAAFNLVRRGRGSL